MARETNMPPFGEETFNPFKQFNPLKLFKFPGIDMETLLSSYQKNMELVATTQEIAAESTKSIMELQNAYVKKVFDEWNEHLKYCCSQAPLEEKTAHHAETAKATVNQTIEQVQKLNSILAKSSAKMFSSTQKRIKEGVDESMNLQRK
jgi:phasin family protein